MAELGRDPRKVALLLLSATSLSDWWAFRDLDAPPATPLSITIAWNTT